jgi:hypothetical protein
MTSALEILGGLVPTKVVLGSVDDAADYAQRLGWHVEAVDPADGLRGCFSKALLAGTLRVLVLDKGVRRAGGGNDLRALNELAKLLDHPYDAISLGTCVDPDGSLESWGGCDTFKRAPGFQYVFETNCTCTIGTIYSSAYMQRYMQRPRAPDRAFTLVPELLLRAQNTRPIRRAPAIVYDPYGRVSMRHATTCRDHPLLIALVILIVIYLHFDKLQSTP